MTDEKRAKDSIDMAVHVLVKWIPEKPDKQLIMDSTVWFCPICDDVAWSSDHNCKRPNFCPYCGQKLDWSEE